MVSVTSLWNPKQALLKDIIYKADRFNDAMDLTLELHSYVHTAEMLKADIKTFEDEVWDGLDIIAFSSMPTKKDVTIAWNIWHITRIEDITTNILIADDVQIIKQNDWLQKINAKVEDTGNAMSDEEIINLSSAIDMEQLRNYRIAVGRKTREIIKSLKPEDMKRKVEAVRLQRILDEGGVLEAEDSIWLLDFWGRKNIGGILLMPITRHQMGHINDSLKLKEKCMKKLKKA